MSTGGTRRAERKPIDPRGSIGDVHLKVADLERALGFWRDVLAFEVQEIPGRLRTRKLVFDCKT